LITKAVVSLPDKRLAGRESTMTEIEAQEAVKQPERPKLLEIMGPGLITGASDDDPSGIRRILKWARSSGMAWDGPSC
jgi:hypothetical protein